MQGHKAENPMRISVQADEVAWECRSARCSTGIVKKHTRPPAVLGGLGDGHDIPGLKVELFVGRGVVVV